MNKIAYQMIRWQTNLQSVQSQTGQLTDLWNPQTGRFMQTSQFAEMFDGKFGLDIHSKHDFF